MNCPQSESVIFDELLQFFETFERAVEKDCTFNLTHNSNSFNSSTFHCGLTNNNNNSSFEEKWPVHSKPVPISNSQFNTRSHCQTIVPFSESNKQTVCWSSQTNNPHCESSPPPYSLSSSSQFWNSSQNNQCVPNLPPFNETAFPVKNNDQSDSNNIMYNQSYIQETALPINNLGDGWTNFVQSPESSTSSWSSEQLSPVTECQPTVVSQEYQDTFLYSKTLDYLSLDCDISESKVWQESLDEICSANQNLQSSLLWAAQQECQIEAESEQNCLNSGRTDDQFDRKLTQQIAGYCKQNGIPVAAVSCSADGMVHGCLVG